MKQSCYEEEKAEKHVSRHKVEIQKKRKKSEEKRKSLRRGDVDPSM